MEKIEEEKSKKSIFSKIIFLSVIILICCYAYLYNFRYEIKNFSEIDGISQEALNLRGILYEVNEDVIHFIFKRNKPYTLLFRPVNTEIFGSEPMVFEGSAKDFNNLVAEIKYVCEKSGSFKSYAKEIGKGGYFAIVDILKGIIDLIRHPIESIKGIKNLGVEIINVIKEIVSGNLKIDELKKSVYDFADRYWFDYKCKHAKEYGFDYQTIVFPITEKTVTNYCSASISGAATVEIATCFLSYLKISKAGKFSKLKNFFSKTEISRLFKIIKVNKISKPLVSVGTKFEEKYVSLINKIKNKHNKNGLSKNTTNKKRKRTTKKEEEVYAKSNLGEFDNIEIDGQTVQVRPKQNIDGDIRVVSREKGPDGKSRRVEKSNCDLMKAGKAPYADDGTRIELHHHKQENVLTDGKSYYVELSKKEHSENYNELHFREPKTPEETKAHNGFREKYWKNRYTQICN